MTLRIGNPTSADIMRWSVRLTYGEAKPEGELLTATDLEQTLSAILAKGSFTDVTVNLGGTSPNKLGYVSVGEISADRIQLYQ